MIAWGWLVAAFAVGTIWGFLLAALLLSGALADEIEGRSDDR